MAKKGNNLVIETSKMPPNERLTWLLDQAIADPHKGVITFIGPTQQGKTHFIKRYFQSHGYNMVIVKPQNDLPEDIGGWPKVTWVKEKPILSFTQPSFLPPRLLEKVHDPSAKIAIYIDEGDKARDDVLSCLLSLLNDDERNIRETHFGPHVAIVMSMNETSRLADPFVARCMFIAFPQEDMNVTERPDLSMVKHFAHELCPPPLVSFPARPDTPGSLHKLVRWMKEPTFWTDSGIKWAIVRGLFSEKGATVVMSRLGETIPMHGKLWAENVKASELNEHIIQVLSSLDYKEQVEVLTVLATTANNDPTGEFDRAFTVFLNCPAALLAVKREDKLEEGQAALKEAVLSALKEAKVVQKKK